MIRPIVILIIFAFVLNLGTNLYNIVIRSSLSLDQITNTWDQESQENEESEEKGSEKEDDQKFSSAPGIFKSSLQNTSFFWFTHRDEFLAASFQAKLIQPPDLI